MKFVQSIGGYGELVKIRERKNLLRPFETGGWNFVFYDRCTGRARFVVVILQLILIPFVILIDYLNELARQ